jgi:hypothetical protein
MDSFIYCATSIAIRNGFQHVSIYKSGLLYLRGGGIFDCRRLNLSLAGLILCATFIVLSIYI